MAGIQALKGNMVPSTTETCTRASSAANQPARSDAIVASNMGAHGGRSQPTARTSSNQNPNGECRA